ncbi:unnamed protein product [Caenorhabditis bovis]|uniref:Clusterin-associated protein 1 homolog n=1 Tax=Caenorhabditis bovis TaxID=2654633 RepID=A0A8S1FAG6_9PELO|nr:unnamed protein product [Caenorhabditis bovis]
MSYRELRNLCEMTRTLRYPRLLSIENFRTPNFQLVAELLEWIVKKFEPEASLNAQNIETEQDRVMFIKQAALLMLQNSRLKMNTKKLYMADGHAVKELLPALKVLYDARRHEDQTSESLQTAWAQTKQKLMSKLQEIRVTRQLSSQLPETGAALSDYLEKQARFARERDRAASRAIPLAEAEKTLQLAINAIIEEADQLQTRLSNVASDEAELDEKIERKEREYEQMQKRFAKLQAFRPQYMDEYERYEEKLRQLYEVYVLNFRNLAYLQKVNDDLAKNERNRQEENEKAMRLAVEKMRLEQEKNNNIGLTDDDVDMPLVDRRGSVRKVYGNMTGAGMSDDDDDDDDEDDDEKKVPNKDIINDEDDEDDGIGMIANSGNDDDDDDKGEMSSGDDF